MTQDYYLGKYEVTQAQWRKVMGGNPSYFENCDNCPVEGVSWNDVQKFLRKLNAATGKWEYATRGGNKSKGYQYAGSNDIHEVAWYAGNSGDKTHPVGQKAANALGLYDMTGNVREWCADRYGIYSGGSQTDPKGPCSGRLRVLRGGSWDLSRGGGSPDLRLYDCGFRLCLSL